MNEGTSPRVYFVAGLGFYRLSVSDLDIRQGSDVGTVTVEAENALGLNGGVGVDIAVGDNVNMFVEGQYVVGFTEGDSTGHIPVRVGLLFKIGS